MLAVVSADGLSSLGLCWEGRGEIDGDSSVMNGSCGGHWDEEELCEVLAHCAEDL